MPICFHVTPAVNLPAILEEGLIPKLGARSQLLGEREVGIFAFPDLDHLHDGMANWLGDAFDEDETLAVLAIDVLPEDVAASPMDWEVRLVRPISPTRLSIITADMDVWDGKWEAQPSRLKARVR